MMLLDLSFFEKQPKTIEGEHFLSRFHGLPQFVSIIDELAGK